jgi:hypothetical protein
MPSFDARLNDAIEALYAAFAVYPAPRDLEGSKFKDVAGMFRALKAAPLRKLTGDQIGPYAGSALLTVGGVDDYKHYLPRIIEQAVLQAPYMGTDPAIIAERLKRAGWRSWPEREKTALRSVFEAAWSWSVEQHPESGAEASDWLCGIAALREPLLPVLNDWSARPSMHALLQAAWLGMMAKDLPSCSEDELGYWSYVTPEDRRLVVEWVTSAERIASFRARIDAVDAHDRWYVEKAID